MSVLSRTTGLLVAGLVLLLGSAPGLYAQELIKIGVVDLDRVVLQSPSGKELQEQLVQFQTNVQGQLDSMKTEADAIRATAKPDMAQDQLAGIQRQYEDKLIEMRRLRDDKTREAEKLREDGLADIQTQLEPLFKKIRDEQGFDLILNNVPGVVVMVEDEIDITNDIIQLLNSGG